MEFKLITPDSYQLYKHFFETQIYDLCVYSLPSLVVWTNSVSKHYAAIENDLLVIYIDYPKVDDMEKHLVMPVSLSGNIPTPEALYKLAKSTGFNSYHHIPGEYFKAHDQNSAEPFFKIEEQPEYHDYVYKTSDLAFLKGNKFSKKRNLIHQFKKDFVEKRSVQIEKITPSAVNDCLNFLEKWCEKRDCEEDKDISLACEKEAVIKALENIETLSFKGIYLTIDNEVSALGIASKLNEHMGVLHFEKAFTHIKGLYQYFDSECAKRLFKGYPYMNKESDMGIPGIAKAKHSYHPVKIVKSFKLTLR